MKSLLTLCFIFLSMICLLAQKRSKKEPKVDCTKIIDSLNSVITSTQEVYEKELLNFSKKQEKVLLKNDLMLSSLSTTRIDSNDWAVFNLGAGLPHRFDDQSLVDQWLNEYLFIRCTNEKEWKENENQARYLAPKGTCEMGYYFSLLAIQKINDLLKQDSTWRIAEFQDFKALFNHASNLNIKSATPFQLLVGNPKTKEMREKFTWKGQVVYDIYGMQISPNAYYTGFDALLTNEGYVDYFSKFSDRSSDQFYVTHIFSENKILPLELKFGVESLNYGFFIRLIKI